MSDAEKRAPVQGYSAGIHWSLHLRAWDAYAAKYGGFQSAADIARRGGFSTGELDGFVPGWRDEVDEINSLRDRIAVLELERESAMCQIPEHLKKLTLSPEDILVLVMPPSDAPPVEQGKIHHWISDMLASAIRDAGLKNMCIVIPAGGSLYAAHIDMRIKSVLDAVPMGTVEKAQSQALAEQEEP